MKKYLTIEEYLKANPYFDKPVNELWIVDNIAIKSIEIKNLLPNNFHPKIQQTEEVIDIIKEFYYKNEKSIINNFEKQILVDKIIKNAQNYNKFKKLENNIDNLITCIDNIRLYPSYLERFESLNNNIDNSSLILKNLAEELLLLYRIECKNNNFIDEIDIKLEIAKIIKLKLKSFDKIVLYGNFLPVAEISWKILQNYCFSNTSQIEFVGSISPVLAKFFENKDFIEYQNLLKDFFFSEQDFSWSNQLKNLNPEKISFTKFSDWDEELNFIAREIKTEIIENKLLPEDVGIYIPKEDLYSFKVEKVLDDFDLPYQKSYSSTFSRVPLGNFTRWLLNIDFNSVSDCIKLFKSPFTSINYNDFSLPHGEKVFFNECELISDNYKIEFFDPLYLESVLASSGINFLNEKKNEVKLEENFKRKIKYDLKRNGDNISIIQGEYLKSYFYLKYFSEKVNSLKELLPKSSLPEQFKNSLLNLLRELKVDQRFLNENENKPGYYNNTYNALISVVESLSSSLALIENKEYTIKEYSEIFASLAEAKFFNEEEKTTGILITELPYISKISLKKICQVGMVSSAFPTESGRNVFANFLEIFKPFKPRETQLLAFAELLNRTKNANDFHLNLSYPVVVNNEENEPSEIFSDLGVVLPSGRVEFKTKKYLVGDKIYSLSEKLESMAKNRFSKNREIEKVHEMLQKRNNFNEWSEYEGNLNILNDELEKGHTSISQVEEFAKCPMKYFFNYKLNLKKSGKTFKDIDATLKGTLIHKILEIYYLEAKEREFFKNKNLLDNESKSLMLKITNDNFKTFEESLNNLYIDRLKDLFIAGLAENDPRSGILLELLQSDQERMVEGKIPSHFEYKFEHKIHGMNFKGVIDRIDDYEENLLFDVIDYKTGDYFDPSEKGNEILDGLSFQLPVYSEAYRKHGRNVVEGGYYLLSKISKDDKVVFLPPLSTDQDVEKRSSIETKKLDFGLPPREKLTVEEKVERSLEHLKKLKERLLNSKYIYTQLDHDKVCEYCDYSSICRYNENKAEFHNNKENFSHNLILDSITPDIFTFPDKNTINETGLTENQKQALDWENNIIVTAGAGAGKTETLTKRMFELIKETKGDIEKILVVTFTKKATAEMQNRIYEYINQSLLESENGASKFIKKAKLNFNKNWISTLDAFYLRILKENILEFEINTETEISEEKDLLVLINDTVVKKVDELAEKKDENLSLLLDTWKRDTLIKILTKLINVEWINEFINTPPDNLLKKYRETYIKQAKRYKEYISEKVNRLENPINHPGISKFIDFCLETTNFYLSEFDKFISSSDNYEYFNKYEDDFIKNRTGFGFPALRKDVKEILDMELIEQIKSLLRPFGRNIGELSFFLIQSQYLLIENKNILSLVALLKIVKNEYDKVKKERKITTFSDISLNLYNLLRNDPEARNKLAKKFDFVMIDEFQDTNLYQYEIAKYLAGWDGKSNESIQKNKLFFVGDEKQSIYEFRGGDVQVFNSAKNEIKEINGKHINFPHNFRSGSNLVEFFNSFFKETFESGHENGKKIYEAEHQELIGVKNEGSVNFILINKGDKQIKETRQNKELEPQIIATVIKKILTHNPSEDIAILFRTKKRIPIFAQALEKSGINHVIYGGTGFYENQEIMDVLNILLYITDEKRLLEFAGFLRSPLAGLSDKEIFALKPNFKKRVKEKYPELYSKIFGIYEGKKLIKKGWKQLSCELKKHELIEKILNDTFFKFANNFETVSAQKLKNIERFIEIAKEHDAITLEEFLESIEFQIENNIDESNAKVLEIGKIKPVQLMTIHKAKGLGFNTVIIADAAAESFKPHSETLQADDLEIFHSDEILKNFIGLKVRDPQKSYLLSTYSKDSILELIRNREEAELKRLLYVAMTRAKNNLIISASCWNTLFQMGNRAMTMFRFIFDYFKEGIINDQGTKIDLRDLVTIPPINNVDSPEVVDKIIIRGFPFYIFNENYNLKLEKERKEESTEYLPISESIISSKPKIYSYSTIKNLPEKIKELVNEREINIVVHQNKKIKVINYNPLIKDKNEEGGKQTDRGNAVHKLFEYDISLEEIAKNMLKNNLGADLVENAWQHYLNLKTILADISSNVISDYRELPFLSGQFTGIFDKLVKTNDGWEIWDYKVSDASREEKVISEATENYQVQYHIYTQELCRLLNLKEIKYKLLFSNFGVVEIS